MTGNIMIGFRNRETWWVGLCLACGSDEEEAAEVVFDARGAVQAVAGEFGANPLWLEPVFAWVNGEGAEVPGDEERGGAANVCIGQSVSVDVARPASRVSAANPSSVPGQCARTASRPARRTTLRSTALTMMASSA